LKFYPYKKKMDYWLFKTDKIDAPFIIEVLDSSAEGELRKVFEN